MATRRDVDAVIAQKWAGGVPGQMSILDADPANEPAKESSDDPAS